MAQTIKLKRSATSGAAPTTSQLELGEVAINTYDGKMYIKKNVGGTESIVEITGGSGGSSTLGGLSDVTISSAAADQLLQYNGSEWVNVSIAEASAIMKEYQFTATSGQSTFSGSDDNSETLSYTAGAIQVFLNGIFLDSAVDYTATNGTSIVLSETVDANDYLQVVAFKKKIGDGSVSVDTFTGNGSTTAFTLSVDPGDENNTRVFVDGVYQSKSNYSVSSTTLTFSTAPPADTAVEVEIGNRVVTLDTLSDLDLPDDVKLRLGTSQDADFYHDGTDTYLRNQTGQLLIRGNDTKLQSYLGETYATFANNGAATLYYDNSAKFATTSSGIQVTGNIANVSGDMTLDVANDIILDADGGDIRLADSGTQFGKLSNNGTDLVIESLVSNRDIVFKGADGSSVINALILDMSDGGGAHFNNDIYLADNRAVRFGDQQDFRIYNDGNHTTFHNASTNHDMVFKGSDDGSPINALTLDMSNAGKATFSGIVNSAVGFERGNLFITQNEIDVSSGNLTLDVAGDIILDADGRDVYFADGGTNYFQVYNDVSNNVILNSVIQDKDIKFTGNDGGSSITALTLDMSASGAAIFNDQITLGGNLIHAGNLTIDAGGDITLDAAGNDIILKDSGTTFGQLTNDSGNLIIYNSGSQMLKGLSLGSNAEFIGTVKIPKLGVNAAPNSNYSLYSLQNGSITHAAYLQVNGSTATGLEINASASSAYSGDVLYARQSSRNTGGNLARFANSDGDKFVVNTSGNVGIGTDSPESKLTIEDDDATLRIRSATTTTKGLSLKYNHSGNFGQLLVDHQGNNQLDMKYYALTHKFGRNDSSQFVTIDDAGRLLVGSTTTDASSSERFLVKSTGGNHSRFVNASDNFTTVYIKNTSTTANTNQPFLTFQDTGGNRGNFGLRYSTAQLVIQGHGGVGIAGGSGGIGQDPDLFVNSSGNVGIGTTSPAQKLHVVGTSRPALIGSDNAVNIVKLYNSATGSTTYNGLDLLVNSTSDSQINSYGMPLTFGTSSSNGTNVTERMRINASGDWMVGNTVPNVSSNYNNQAGCGWVESDHHFEIATTNNRSALEVSKNNANDGEIVTFRKQGNVVGRLGTFGTDLYLGQNNSGLRFEYAGLDAIVPFDADSVAINDNVITLGHANARFKDLHLSGTSYTNEVELAEIDASISQTAYDIFVYDTRNDSDGGAWRYRTQHTSWYNETLNTSTRGSRREFPTVALLVTTEAGTLSIYDADDPDLPLWMSITPINLDQARVVALNGVILFGNRYVANTGYGGNGFIYYNFAGDYSRHGLSNGSNPSYIPEINSVPSGNMGTHWPKRPNSFARYYTLSDYSVLDVAITTLPNAPIDSRSGLPVPTMAVAHLDGLTVFKDDGNSYLLSGSNWADITYRVNFDKFGVLYFGQMAYAIIGCDVKGLHQSYTNMVDGRPSYRAGLDDYPFFQAHGENGNGWGASQPFALGSRDDFDLAQWSYYTHPDHRIVRTQMNHDLRDTYRGSSALMNYTGFDFNTGWMHGEIRGAYLSDTSTTAASSTATFTDDFSNSNNWSHADGSAITGGALVLANQSSSRATNLDWGGTTSKRYLLEVDVTSTNGGTCVLDDDGVGAGQGSATNYGVITASGTYYTYFTKTGSARLRWLRTAGGPITINSMSIHELEDDRSMSDRGLRAYGTITKSAVNTGTDLVGYSGFSSSNYLKGYPSVGSSMTEVSLYGWFKHDGGGSTQEMVRIGNSSSTSYFISLGRVTSSADENWRFYYGGNQGSISISDSDSSAANTWYFLMMTVSPTTIKCYVNAQLVDVRENTYSYLNTGSNPYIQLGNNVQVVTSDNFTASNVRFSESVPTDAQVDKMYNDEKHLYLTNAQATMYGGSGSILLEYDDQTKLLHAGTAAGRSVFQGLRRVEATTDAVTVMISASNGLVVEE